MRDLSNRTAVVTILLFLTLFQSASGKPRHIKAKPKPVPQDGMPIQAPSAILVDAETGQVLFERAADTPRPPASTTKILTSILLLENTKPSDIITAGQNTYNVEGSSLYLKPGEKLTADDMLYALMLRSANDGCVAVAEYVAGSEARFVAMMNKKAREIGTTHSTFMNCNGLPSPGHVATARDLALLARYASRYEPFCLATRTKFRQVNVIGRKGPELIRNHAKFLWRFAGADGVKTGYTNEAGRCFVGAATIDGWRLISVVMNSPDIVGETTELINHGFSAFKRKVLLRSGTTIERPSPVTYSGGERLTAVISKPLSIDLEKRSIVEPEVVYHWKTDITAPVAIGDTVGTVSAEINGIPIASVPLISTKAVRKSLVLEPKRSGIGWLIGGGLVTLAAVLYGMSTTKAARIRRHRLKARMRIDDNLR